MGALGSVWGAAAAAFIAAAVAAAILLRGQARLFSASLAGVVAVLLVAIGALTAPQEEVTPEQALGGIATNVPRTGRDIAALLLTQAAREADTGKTEDAQKTYERAKQTYRAAKDVLGEANVALGVGRLEHMTGQSAKARQAFGSAITLFQQGGSALGMARTYASWGDLEKDTFQWAKAGEHYKLAREQWQRAPEPKSDPHVMLGIEDAALMRQGEARARANLDQAKKIYDQLGNKVGIAEMGMIQAQLEMNLGRIDLARAQFSDARNMFNAAGDKSNEAEAGLQMALINIRRGFNREALSVVQDSKALFDEVGNAVGGGRIRIAVGDLERLQGRLEQARVQYADAASILTPTSHRAEAEALRKLGEVEAALERTDAANRAFERAIAVAARAGYPEEEALAHLGAAAQARQAGQAGTAQTQATAANALFDKAKNAVGRARSAVLNATEHNGFTDAAARAKAANLPFGTAMADLDLGDALRANGNNTDAQAAYRAADTAWGTMANKTTEANILLGLPPVDELQIVPEPVPTEFYDVDARPEVLEADLMLVKANLAEFPNHNIEARKLVEKTEQRLNAAREFLRER